MAGKAEGHAPIIVKKIKKVSGGGHHGGAWKVAYADFVTAMMAFFLLMWLLNATSEEQLHGLADYFDPSLPISRNSAGGAGMLQGETIFTPERVAGSVEDGERPRPSHRAPGETLGTEAGFTGETSLVEVPGGAAEPGAEPGTGFGTANGEEAGAADPGAAPRPGAGDAGEGEEGRLAEIGEDLLEQVREASEGDLLLRHFSMRMTPEGLVIEIADAEGAPLFEPGSAAPSELLTDLLEVVVPLLNRVVNDVAVVGHTDATPFRSRTGYDNWELSTDRANAARREMVAIGLPETRMARVSGRGDTQPLSDDPLAAQNRRIAIILLREGLGR